MDPKERPGEISSRRFMEAATAAWPHLSPLDIWKAWVERHDVWQAILAARKSPEAEQAMGSGADRDRDLAFLHWLEDPANLKSIDRAADVMRRAWELDEIDLREVQGDRTGSGRGR
ncbi:MAG TPA: hypothetical protein VFA11_04605 [Acidimicrobiales bacterium]|nr:hypothetical protein [Acidimicrobiales bacterium]